MIYRYVPKWRLQTIRGPVVGQSHQLHVRNSVTTLTQESENVQGLIFSNISQFIAARYVIGKVLISYLLYSIVEY